MGKFDPYKVELKNMQQNTQEIEYLLDNDFFTHIDGEEVQKGKVNVQLTVAKVNDMYDLSFQLNGQVMIPCDRCLDDMTLPVETTSHLIVKMGKDFSEESDEIVIIPETEGYINLAWFLYEFVALTIPIKHVHGPGKCNKQMSSKLKKHTASLEGDESAEALESEEDIIISDNDDTTDPRWDALKDLK